MSAPAKATAAFWVVQGSEGGGYRIVSESLTYREIQEIVSRRTLHFPPLMINDAEVATVIAQLRAELCAGETT